MSIRPDGGDPRPITASAGGNRIPEVSPDGRSVAFVSTRDGNPEIYETGIDGGEARRLTKTGDRENSPRYLPNGDLIYVVAKGSKGPRDAPVRGHRGAAPGAGDRSAGSRSTSHATAERVAYVVGQLADAGKGKSQFTLRIQPLGGNSAPLCPAPAGRAGAEPLLLRVAAP